MASRYIRRKDWASIVFWRRKSKKLDEQVVLYPWVAWSEQDTEKAKETIRDVFDKEPPELDSGEASTVLVMIQSNREGGMAGTLVDGAMAETLMKEKGISMDPDEQDPSGRLRYPDIVRKIGFSQEVMDELKIGF